MVVGGYVRLIVGGYVNLVVGVALIWSLVARSVWSLGFISIWSLEGAFIRSLEVMSIWSLEATSMWLLMVAKITKILRYKTRTGFGPVFVSLSSFLFHSFFTFSMCFVGDVRCTACVLLEYILCFTLPSTPYSA